MIDLPCNLIFGVQISGNWKKQLQCVLILAVFFRDQFKSKKVNLSWESSGLSIYYVLDLKRLDTKFEIDYASALEQLSKIIGVFN